MRGDYGMQIRRCVQFFHQIRRFANSFVQIWNHNHIRTTEVQELKGKLISVNVIVNLS